MSLSVVELIRPRARIFPGHICPIDHIAILVKDHTHRNVPQQNNIHCVFGIFLGISVTKREHLDSQIYSDVF